MSASGIYAIVRKGTDECYIGSAVNLPGRWACHRHELRSGKHSSTFMQNVFNKHGDVFEYAILEQVADKANLIAREQVWLDRFGPVYNTAKIAGSSLGMKLSAETRAKMSARQMGNTNCLGHKQTAEHRAASMASNLGRARTPHTPETKAKLSAKLTGRKTAPFTAEHCAKISAALTGRKRAPFTAEAIANMSAAGIRRAPATPEHRANISAATKGLKRTDEHRANLSAAKTGKKLTAAHRANMSAAQFRRQATLRAQRLAE